MRREQDSAGRDQSLVARMDTIHLARSSLVGGRLNPVADRRFNYARADRDYESAFREAGVGAIGDDAEGVARRIAASTVREPLLAALADWSACATPRESPGVGPRGGAESRPGALARPRPRSRCCGPTAPRSPRLARTAPLSAQPVPFLVALGERLWALGGDGTEFLARVHQAHPDDFWAALTLARALQEGADREAAAPRTGGHSSSGKTLPPSTTTSATCQPQWAAWTRPPTTSGSPWRSTPTSPRPTIISAWP